jgi:two-component sensor histidine kinase
MDTELAVAPRRILLVEDEEGHSSIILRAFEGDKGFQLTVATTIAEAVAAAHFNFDLVISDWRLPDGEAFDLLIDRRFPLLIMTSRGNEKIAVKAMKAGALDYVVKSESVLLDMPRLAEGAIRLWTNIVAKELAEKELQRVLAEKIALLQEVHHRVTNNLQVICGLLSMQIAAASEGHPSKPLADAYSRILAMSYIQGQIYSSPTLTDIDFGEFIEKISNDMFVWFCGEPSRIRLELSVEAIRLDMDHAMPCGLILSELISNSLKHGFSDGREGLIRVSFRKTEGDCFELVVADNGVGLPAGFRPGDSRSPGMLIVTILVKQLRANLSVAGEDGTTFTVSWKP